MLRRTFVGLSVAIGLILPTFVLFAHHGSNISYNLDQLITLKGVATEWEFVNPHPQIYFDVTVAGEVEHWAAELLPTPSMMRNMRVGWSRDTIKPGDQIVLSCNPPRAEGRKACLAKELEVNGQVWSVMPGPPGGGKGKAKDKGK